MKKLLISFSCLLLALALLYLGPDELPNTDLEYYIGFFFAFGSILLICISALYLLWFVMSLLQSKFPKMGRKQTLLHSMAFFATILGLSLFFLVNQGEFLDLKWYQHYYIVFPLASYSMAILVMILNPIQSYKEINSNDSDIDAN